MDEDQSTNCCQPFRGLVLCETLLSDVIQAYQRTIMQLFFETVLSNAELDPEQASQAVTWLADPAADAKEKERFLEALRQKGETCGEIAAFASALTAMAVDPRISPGEVSGPMLDVCGTGGDRLELFNISTASMFLLAAGGVTVVKHGNRAITSQCGGADVLEALGVRIEMAPEELRETVCRHGLGFIYAPAYHPAFAVIGPVRRALAQRGVPTIFNLLGPLLNPARPAHQLVGVYSTELLEKYAGALLRLGRKHAWAVHGCGADELTLAGPSKVIAVEDGGLRGFSVDPAALGLKHAPVEALRGGGRETNAGILIRILEGTLTGAPADAVMLNSAAGFVVAGVSAGLEEGLQLARESIASGAALRKLEALRKGASS